MTPPPSSAFDWEGQKVLDRDGEKIGTIEEIYLVEETGRAEWALVKVDRLRRRSTLAPLLGARPVRDGIRVDYDKSTVKDAPPVDAEDEPSEEQVAAAVRLGAPVVEFHTGRYAHLDGEERAAELKRIADCAALAVKNGIEPHAGHGLTFDNVVPVAAIPQLAELNIGHFLIGEAIFVGLEASVSTMRRLMDEARTGAAAA